MKIPSFTYPHVILILSCSDLFSSVKDQPSIFHTKWMVIYCILSNSKMTKKSVCPYDIGTKSIKPVCEEHTERCRFIFPNYDYEPQINVTLDHKTCHKAQFF